eukprot:4689119-Heterocapsa_arctica.AAC.1
MGYMGYSNPAGNAGGARVGLLPSSSPPVAAIPYQYAIGPRMGVAPSEPILIRSFARRHVG